MRRVVYIAQGQMREFQEWPMGLYGHDVGPVIWGRELGGMVWSLGWNSLRPRFDKRSTTLQSQNEQGLEEYKLSAMSVSRSGRNTTAAMRTHFRTDSRGRGFA